MKYNIISHITTSCNFDCSYCDVIKDNKNLWEEEVKKLIIFIKNNHKYINRFKFFGWEPTLGFKNVKKIIDETNQFLWKKYEIVTNTTLLNDEIWWYFQKYFELIFFSIDSENHFDLLKIFNFTKKFSLFENLYINLIISPWEENKALKNYYDLKKLWFKNFNILPVYFTKTWEDIDLENLSKMMKIILDDFLKKDIFLYWFQQNEGYNSSLVNNSLFIDIDLKIYFSDFVSTYIWKTLKKSLYLWETQNLDISKLEKEDFKNMQKSIYNLEKIVNLKVKWQTKLHKIMDYYSNYLNKKNGI